MTELPRRKKQITDEVVCSYLDCPRKAFLQLQGRRGEPTEYEQHMREFHAEYRAAATAHIEQEFIHRGVLRRARLTPSTALRDHDLIIANSVRADEIASGPMALVRSNGRADQFEPVCFCRYAPITARNKVLLGYGAALARQVTHIAPTRGLIVHGPDFHATRVGLTSHLKKADAIVERLEEIARSKGEPLFLNPHCEVCEFQASCRVEAEAEDNMSLMHGMRRGHIEKLNRRGLFTLNQLSYTFRPRRPPKRAKNPAKPRHFALQAQAIREGKIYVHGAPELPACEHRLYFDVEGVPGSGLYYLIGVLMEVDGRPEYRAFWADDEQTQARMFVQFCQFASSFPGALLFHYGSYDSKALSSLAALTAGEDRDVADVIIDSCRNVLPALHSHCYFPIQSIRLRDVGHLLGCHRESRIHSGAQSIVFRERWERSRAERLQDDLVAYNREDCLALKAVCDFIDAVPSLASAGGRIPGRPEEVASTDSLRKPGEGKRSLYKKTKFVLPEFDLVNRCAYFDYQRERVYARPGKKRKSKPNRRRPQASWRNSEAKDVVVKCDRCVLCGSSRLEVERVRRRHLIDLKYFRTGIGVKRWQPRYQIHEYRCLRCGGAVIPPGVAYNAKSRTIYGHGLMCWCVYHNIVGKQSLLQVYRSLRDIFGIKLPQGRVYCFRSAIASYYRRLYEEILDAILREDVINIDETPVKLRKTVGYVWILATADKVYCMFRDSREGDFLKDLLSCFSGVLVSDFFTAYDSIGCRHQKCLIHLMRDVNEDLRKHPFDSELRLVAEPFGRVLADAVSTIDRWGLSKYHLHKHVKQAKRMLAKLSQKQFVSEPALKYQKRFKKYGPSLFTFLSQDGVPWNNNNAEHAVHYFAKLRRLTDGTFTEKSIRELLVLVSVLQTCEYSGVNPLRFLLSAEDTLDGLSAMAGNRRHKSP